jgi:hypothetical protein
MRREMKQEMITWDIRTVSKGMTRLGLSNIAIGTFDKKDSLHALESPFL